MAVISGLLPSLATQVCYYTNLIQNNPKWEYAGVYSDEGISGTSISKRDNFTKLLEDCENHKIDIILTKSISRFARNTVDLLKTVRHLKELGISVRFEKENIDSLSGDGELMITLLASFAQSEAETISNNVKWAIHKKMEKGIPNGRPAIYGYAWDGYELKVNSKEAKIIKIIFAEFLCDKSPHEIANELNRQEIKNRKGNDWAVNTIKKMLRNPIYSGQLLLQKRYSSDPINQKDNINHGELPKYLIDNHHEAIIDFATFNKVQEKIKQRAELKYLLRDSTCCFTSKIKCPHCQRSYGHVTHQNRGFAIDYWICYSELQKKLYHTTCPICKPIGTKVLKEVLCDVLGITNFDEQIFLEQVDHIEVPKANTLDIFMNDGTQIRKYEPRLKRYSDYEQKNINGHYHYNCFSLKIKCACCGKNYKLVTAKTCNGNRNKRYVCNNFKNCSNVTFKEKIIYDLTAKALGLQEFDEITFANSIYKIEVHPSNTVTFIFYDDSTVELPIPQEDNIGG